MLLPLPLMLLIIGLALLWFSVFKNREDFLLALGGWHSCYSR
ncbi:hypothetical protein OHC95_24735 [Escherichia coli]|nr:hypothetical protein [Escherichia coli]MCW7275379.1 hypothetical protein [Escherichia coli]